MAAGLAAVKAVASRRTPSWARRGDFADLGSSGAGPLRKQGKSARCRKRPLQEQEELKKRPQGSRQKTAGKRGLALGHN